MTELGCVLEAHFSIGLIFVGLLKVTTTNFATASNAAQFFSLENLIGSLHKYASEDAQLFVINMGLTEGQRLLLEKYQNVKIVSSARGLPKYTRSIDVHNELSSIDNIFVERKANGDLPYADSIRKQFRLAVVIPFIRSELENLRTQLNISNIYIPCRNRYNSVDLIFYHNEASSSSLQTAVHQIKYINKCYHRILFLAANMTDNQDHYIFDRTSMWLKLILEVNSSGMSLRNHGYTHFFFMEPNTLPIRSFWLDTIIEQIIEGHDQNSYHSTDWWITGSIYRDQSLIDQLFIHINANALYHLSPKFIFDIQLNSRIHLIKPSTSINQYLATLLVPQTNTNKAKPLWHKFRPSEYIKKNCDHTSNKRNIDHNAAEFILNNPHTYLIYCDQYHQDTSEIENTYFQRLLLQLTTIIIIIVCLHRLYQHQLKLIQ